MSEIVPTANADAGVAKRKASSYANYVFIVLFFVNFLNYLDRYILTGAANTIAKELNFGIDGIGYLASAFLIVFTLTVIPFGVWADRSKRKNIIAICVTIWSLATAFTALAGNFTTLLISRMVMGIGEGGYSPAGGALMADYFSRIRRARVMSWWATAALFGLMFGIIIGGVVAGLGFGKWRLAFLFSGIPGLVLAFLTWRMREPQRNEADEEAAEHSEQEAPIYSTGEADSRLMVAGVTGNAVARFGTLLRVKSLVALTLMQVFSFFVLAASAVYLPTLFQQKDTFGMTPGEAGLFTGIGIAVSGISGMLFGGYLSDALNRRHPGARILVCGIGFLIGAPSYVISVVVGLTSHNIFLYSVFFFLTTFLLNMYAGPSLAAIQDIVPSGLRASAVAIAAFIGHLLGDAFSPSLVGFLAISLDPTRGQHFLAGMAGYDLSMALLYTCPPALAIAGIIGIIGARWVKTDMAKAQLADAQMRH